MIENSLKKRQRLKRLNGIKHVRFYFSIVQPGMQ